MLARPREFSVTVVVAFLAATLHWGDVVKHLFVSPHTLRNLSGSDDDGTLAHFKVVDIDFKIIECI